MRLSYYLLGFQGRRAEQRAALLLYLAAGMYNAILAMLVVLVPLYALHLGFNLATMGAVISSQAVLQISLQLFGGMLADRFGERIVWRMSFTSALAGCLIFLFSSTLAALFAAQFFLGLSRAIYWNAGQTYGTRLSEPDTPAIIARFLGYGSAGLIIGGPLAGAVAGASGFSAAFALCCCFCGIPLAISFVMPALPRRGAIQTVREVIRPVPGLLRMKVLWLGVFMGFLSAMSVALLGSTYIAFFREAGHSEGVIGGVSAIHSIGLVAFGFAFTPVLRRLGYRAMYGLSLVGMGIMTFIMAQAAQSLATLIPIIALLGIVFAGSRILYPVMAALAAPEGLRSTTLAVTGLGWATGMLTIPVSFGALADATSLATVVTVAALILTGAGLVSPILFKLLYSPPESQQ